MKKRALRICIVVICLSSVHVMAGYTQGFVDMDNFQALAAEWMAPAGINDFMFLTQYWLTDQTVPDPNVYWKFEETSGEEILEEIGTWPSDQNLVAQSGLSIADSTRAGRVGNAIRFWDDNDRFEVMGEDDGQPADVLDHFPDEGVTIMGWLRPMAGHGSDDIWFSKLQTDTTPTVDNTQSELYLRCGNDFYVNGRFGSLSIQTMLDANIALTNDTWYHYAFTWEDDNMALYMDGQLVDYNGSAYPITSFIDHDPDNGGYSTTVGSGWIHVYAFTGMIDEVKVWRQALTAAQISNEYDSYPPVTLYTLTVNNGDGDGDYLNDIEAIIVADDPLPGYKFRYWTGDIEFLADPYNPTTTLIMPAQNVTVTAIYGIPCCYSELTVNNGTGSGDYPEDQVVNIVADALDPNYIFTGWTGDIATVADANDPNTTLIMPGVDIEVTATSALRTNMLKVWWPLEETSGNDSDNILSTNGYTDLISTFDIADRTGSGDANAVVGNAMRFLDDGSNKYMKAPGIDEGEAPTFLDIFPDSLTITGWLKTSPDNDSSSYWCSIRPIPNYGFYCTAESDGFYVKIAENTAGTTYNIGGTDPVVDTWYHYAMTWEGTTVILYLDGVQDSINTSVMDIKDFPDATGIGSNTYSIYLGSGWLWVNTFDGQIDEVKMWQAALTANQIAAEYGSY